MSTNTTTAESSYGGVASSAQETVETFVSAVTDALASSNADADLVEEVADAGTDVVEEVSELAETVDELREDVDDERAERTRDIAEDRQRLTDVEDRLDDVEGGSGDATPTPETEQSRTQTPLERVCALPEHSVTDTLTSNQERARFVAKGIKDYGRRVPAGIGIRSSEIRRVLSASEESTIHTQTVSRVMDFLAKLGGDGVRLKTTRSGERTVVFDEEIVERITTVVTDEEGPPVIGEAI